MRTLAVVPAGASRPRRSAGASLVVAAVLAWAWAASAARADATVPAEKHQPVAKWLAGIAEGKADLAPLVVRYDDLHPLHGGLTLAIHGDGRVEQRAVRERIGEPRQVARAELVELVKLLVAHQAWEQRVPERRAVPDESRARLTIAYRGDQTVIWEWYNDLPKNKRLLEIRERMKQLAWKSPPR